MLGDVELRLGEKEVGQDDKARGFGEQAAVPKVSLSADVNDRWAAVVSYAEVEAVILCFCLAAFKEGT